MQKSHQGIGHGLFHLLIGGQEIVVEDILDVIDVLFIFRQSSVPLFAEFPLFPFILQLFDTELQLTNLRS